MTPRHAQLAMLAIELHGQDFSGEQFLTWLLGFSDAEETGRVVTEESRRAFALAEALGRTLCASLARQRGGHWRFTIGESPSPGAANDPPPRAHASARTHVPPGK